MEMGQLEEIYEKNEKEEIRDDMNEEEHKEDEELELGGKNPLEYDFILDTSLEEGLNNK